ncbi:hypothetical protein EK904_013877 [Melospiza melodia maxima]|nr:hypothetical protein EK904_013877 [Melospiza melodia maxima]
MRTALLMTKNNQFLSGKVVEATPASPSTGNPELNSYDFKDLLNASKYMQFFHSQKHLALCAT